MDGGEVGLINGSKVGIVGGGVSGTALAVALLQLARGRGRGVEVQVFDGGRGDGSSIAPVILSPECRARLAGLGCRVPPEWRIIEIAAVEVISGGHAEIFTPPAAGLWVVDGWLSGQSGQRMLSDLLAGTASLLGAKVVPRRVDQVIRDEVGPHDKRQARVNAGPLVVRAQGGSERFHAVALAAGARAELAGRFFPGFQGATTLQASHARLRSPAPRTLGPPVIRLLLSPLPGVDALYLVPCHGSIYAIAMGPTASPADLCQALMAASRDGYVPEGFEIAHLSTTRAPCGPGRRLTAKGLLAVGTAAVGHPLQLGLSETLASVSRAAVALMDCAHDERALHRRYVREGLLEILEDSAAAARAVTWLRRAGPRAAEAFSSARARSGFVTPFSGGVLGLSSPTPLSLLASARWAGLIETFHAWVRPAFEPLPASALATEPDLYYVVDDDTDAREALTSFLESQGAKVVSFADELALFCAVARRPPAAILLDVVLNWVDGLRLCEGLKRHPLTRGTRVFVMSGLDRPHVRDRALEAGAEAFISKPIEPQRLIQLLREHHLEPRPTRAVPVEAPAAVDSGRYAS